MKEILPMLLLIAAPEAGMAQSKAGIKMENLDKTVSPSENFYKFACGGWQKLNPLPAAYSRFGSFDQLQEDNNQRINGIIASLTEKKFAEGSVEKKLSDFYKLAMDSTRRNAEGVAPVKPIMDEIEAAKDIEALRKLQCKYAVIGLGVPYGYYYGSDEKNATMNILNLMQGGLTLGEKGYYLDNDKATADIREAYAKHIETMFGIYGFNEAQAKAKSRAIMRFETALALISKSRTELRDVEANYNKMTLAEFQSNYPNIALTELLRAEGVKDDCFQEMIVGQPQFFAGADKLIATQDAEELRAIMEWSLIDMSAGYLSDNVEAASFDFLGKTMRVRAEDYP